MSRVHDAVGGNEGRIAAFRFAGTSLPGSLTIQRTQFDFASAVRSYRGNEMSATDLVDQMFNILDHRGDEAAHLIGSVADLFEEPDKRQAVLSAVKNAKPEASVTNPSGGFPSFVPPLTKSLGHNA